MKLKKIIAIATLAVLTLQIFPKGFAKAEDSEFNFSANLIALPGENLQNGYLNSQNSAFRVVLEISTGSAFDIAALYLDESKLIDERKYDTGLRYDLSSKTSTNDELKVLLNYNELTSNTHNLSLKVKLRPESEYITYQRFLLKADFKNPDGVITASSTSLNSSVGVGEKVNLKFDLSSSENELNINSSIYGRDLLWKKDSSGLYSSEYIVLEGDRDCINSLSLDNFKATDEAGNVGLSNYSSFPIDFSIDGNSPKGEITSPENAKHYNTSSIPIVFSTDQPDYEIQYYLDSDIFIPQDNTISDIADGEHELKIVLRDQAGNKSLLISKFIVDTKKPELILRISPDDEIEKGSVLIYEGITEPFSNLELEIGEGDFYEATSDSNGVFRFEINSLNLDTNKYKVMLRITDQSFNTSEFIRSPINIKEIKAKDVKPQRLAYSGVRNRSSDVTPIIINQADNLQNESEIAKSNPQISSDTDERLISKNWSAWILLFAIIALATAVSAASFYGYQWIANSPVKGSTSKMEPEIDLEKQIRESISTRVVSQEEKQNPQAEEKKRETRW